VEFPFFSAGSATPVEVLVMPQYLSVTIVREQFQEIGVVVPDDLSIDQAKVFIRKHIEEIAEDLCYETDWMEDSIQAERIMPVSQDVATGLGLLTWDELSECNRSA
jgi:hypothetical protein